MVCLPGYNRGPLLLGHSLPLQDATLMEEKWSSIINIQSFILECKSRKGLTEGRL